MPVPVALSFGRETNLRLAWPGPGLRLRPGLACHPALARAAQLKPTELEAPPPAGPPKQARRLIVELGHPGTPMGLRRPGNGPNSGPAGSGQVRSEVPAGVSCVYSSDRTTVVLSWLIDYC